MTNGARQASACLSFCGGILFKKDDVTLQFQQREAFERGLDATTIRLREKSAKQ